MSQTVFDFVIVGAGSAGCVMANRLSEDPDTTVLLLEAGDWDRDPWIHIPLGWGKIFQARLHDWGYFGEPEPNAGGRAIECARGKIIGGSSSINAMAYVRGHSADFDGWAQSGLEGWSYDDVLPYFRRQESWEKGADAYRGANGPLTVRESRYQDPLTDAFVDAGLELGHPATSDYNGAQQEGFGRLQVTIRRGKRCSAADAFLNPVLRRPNLTVIVNALSERILFDGARAVGIQYRHGGKTQVARADREIILSAGVINSPQILMLSGIGAPEVLSQHGIKCSVPLPGVGQNLQDHLTAMASYVRREPGLFQRNMRLDRIALSLAEAQFLGRGFATDLPAGVNAFIKADPSSTLPDTQLLFMAGSLAAKPYLPPFRQAFTDGFSCRAVLLRPESRGYLALNSANPAEPMRIHWNFLGTDNDKAAMRTSFRAMQDICRQRPMAPFVERALMPDPRIESDADLDDYIRATASTAHHPLGTCRMGLEADPMAVVDSGMKVLGVEALRVVDASVMPAMIGGNINAAVMMIAEKAADLAINRPASVGAREAA